MIVLDGHTLDATAVAAIAAGARCRLADGARARMTATADRVGGEALLRKKWRWLVDEPEPADPDALVAAFLLGHCAGVGAPLEPGVVRAMIAVRANVFALGASGVRPETVDAMLVWLDADVVPVVPSLGSVGAAGSAALAHLARGLCGLGGDVWVAGRRVPASEGAAGLPVLRPTAKEALSLINGATLDAALAALAVHRARGLLDAAIVACALSFEVVRADLGCLSPGGMALRNQPGAVVVAARLRERLDGSTLCNGQVADPFSIRCAPIVLGAVHDAIVQIAAVVDRELNAAIDNPLVLDDEVVEVGNFHGAPVAIAMDHLKIVLVQLASIAERRVFRLTYGQLSGLPSFLVASSGLDSGLMLAQYTAASLVSECKGYSHPASVDAIPTAQHLEDHQSMGPIAARGALIVCEAVADVIAIELMCATQGLDFHLDAAVGRPGVGTSASHAAVRGVVARWVDDRVLHPDLAALGKAVRDGRFR